MHTFLNTKNYVHKVLMQTYKMDLFDNYILYRDCVVSKRTGKPMPFDMKGNIRRLSLSTCGKRKTFRFDTLVYEYYEPSGTADLFRKNGVYSGLKRGVNVFETKYNWVSYVNYEPLYFPKTEIGKHKAHMSYICWLINRQIMI